VVETLGVFNASARQLLADLGRRIAIYTGDARETRYLFQRISVLVHGLTIVPTFVLLSQLLGFHRNGVPRVKKK